MKMMPVECIVETLDVVRLEMIHVKIVGIRANWNGRFGAFGSVQSVSTAEAILNYQKTRLELKEEYHQAQLEFRKKYNIPEGVDFRIHRTGSVRIAKWYVPCQTAA